MTQSYLDTARRVITIEATALSQLSASLGDEFDRAVEILLNATGRVIVSGMGKSGHIARKIAATLASTGTPSHFVHPAEASHGDLGMMAKGDVAHSACGQICDHRLEVESRHLRGRKPQTPCRRPDHNRQRRRV